MDVLSTADGSAQAVREAAEGSGGADSATVLERELDRLNAAINSCSSISAQHLQWTLLAQAVLLAAYLFVLVGAWSLPLPGKRWLLAAIAGYGAVSLVLGYLSQRGSRDRIAPLCQGRQRVEQALERIARRPVVFSRGGVITRSVGDWATVLIPVTLLAGWVALSIYTLSLPLATDTRPAVTSDARPAPRVAPAIPVPAPRAKAGAARNDAAAASAPPNDPPPPEEAGLAALFRRAINAPTADVGESIKP